MSDMDSEIRKVKDLMGTHIGDDPVSIWSVRRFFNLRGEPVPVDLPPGTMVEVQPNGEYRFVGAFEEDEDID